MKKLTLSAVAIAVALSNQAFANDESKDKKDDIETIEVRGSPTYKGYNAHNASGASRLELAIIDIPQSISVITDSQLKDFQLTDIDSALDTATGVNVETN